MVYKWWADPSTHSTVLTVVILKPGAISRHTFLLGPQVLDGAEYRGKYYFRKIAFAGRTLALSTYARDTACGIDCFLVEEEREFSLWQALPSALSSVLDEARPD